MKIYAHRGESALFPENSRTAIKNCDDSQMHGVEIDLYQAGDEFVVFHDRWLTRILGIQKRVVDLTAENLTQIAGRDGQPLPNLKWIIQTFAQSKLEINLELKFITNISQFVQTLKALCANYEFPISRLFISSFNHSYLAQINVLWPEIKLSMLMATLPISIKEQLPKFELYSINFDMNCISAELIKSCQQLGYQVMVYTVDHEIEIEWLFNLGVDAIFSNDPRQANKIINNLNS